MPRIPLLLLCAAFACALPAQTVLFSVEMIGAQESPANSSSGIGSASVKVDLATGAVSVSGRYLNLSGTANAAHIHTPARRGANGGVAVALSVSGGTSGTLTGTGTLSGAALTALRDGLAYLNVHSTAFPGGEIRGQIDDVPGSGSTGAPGVTVSGSATSGGSLTAGCPPTINTAVILLGVALPFNSTLPLPNSIACSVPTNLGLDVTTTFVAIPGPSLTVPIPANTPNVEIAFQCAFITFSNCIDLSTASRIAIRP